MWEKGNAFVSSRSNLDLVKGRQATHLVSVRRAAYYVRGSFTCAAPLPARFC